MKQKVLLLLFSIMLSHGAFAQKEASNWTFGENARLSWQPDKLRSFAAAGLNGTPNTTFNDLPGASSSQIFTHEGCFSISNGNGELLFYSDGVKIWRGNGTEIYSSLDGHSDSAQSGIVVTYPGASNTYICIGISKHVDDKMNYVLVQATNSTDAVVVNAGAQFSGYSGLLGESMTSIRHANGTDWWIIAPGKGSPLYFNAWLATSTGVQSSAPAEITQTSINFASTSSNGYFKFTPDGRHFVWAANTGNALIYGDFDNSTGKFSNIRQIPGFFYGIEFSSNQKYLFTTQSMDSEVRVYDLEALLSGTTTTPLKVLTFGVGGVGYGAIPSGLQLDYMNRLWIGIANTRDMSFIDNPNDESGNFKMYYLSDFLAVSTLGRLGLPSFSASWWNLKVEIETDLELPVCKGTEIEFTATLASSDLAQVKSVKWNFGDGTVVNDTNIGATMTRKYTYKKPGTYTLTLTPYKTDGTIVTGSIKTLEVEILPCVMPVNPNIHMSK